MGVAEICIRVVRNIRQLQHELRTIDDDLKSLAWEVDGLRNICAAVEKLFTSGCNDSLRTGPPKNLQAHLATALANCRSVILKLNDILIKVGDRRTLQRRENSMPWESHAKESAARRPTELPNATRDVSECAPAGVNNDNDVCATCYHRCHLLR